MTVLLCMLACVCVKKEKEREGESKGEGVVPLTTLHSLSKSTLMILSAYMYSLLCPFLMQDTFFH